MFALCHLSSLSLAHLQRAFPSPHVVANTTSWDVLLTRLARRADQPAHDIVIVDPCVADERGAARRLRALADALGTAPPGALIGYVAVTATGIRTAQALSRLGAREIIIRGVDDTPSALAAAVNRAITAHSADRLVRGASGAFGVLPVGVSGALELLFRRPDRLRSVSDLAAAANTTRRSLDRWLARAGLAPARTLLACARANAAFHLLASGRVGRSQAAALVGYASPRSLARELQALTGRSPAVLATALTREVFVAEISRLLRRPQADDSNAGPSY